MDLQDICLKANEIVKKTGKYISNELRSFDQSKVESKGLHNFVSFVDKNAEKQLVEAFQALLPGSGFIAEENTVPDNQSPVKWIIDPLDGTTNFIHGLAPFSISVALMIDNEIVIGIIYEISLDELFYSWKGGKAYLNSKEIQVSKAASVKDSLIGTGFPYYDYAYLPQFMDTINFFMKNSHGIRRLGSAAADLAYVACGRFDAFYEYALSPWDVAAGAFIIQQAGGKVCDFSGGQNYLFGREIIASNNLIFDEFLSDIKSLMKK